MTLISIPGAGEDGVLGSFLKCSCYMPSFDDYCFSISFGPGSGDSGN